MRSGARGMSGLTAAATAIAFASPAPAVEIDRLVGRWSSPDFDECQYADVSEGAPIRIVLDEQGTHIGNYGWLCTVKEWKQDGDFLMGEAKACGQEGGDDPFDEVFRLGLDGEDRLVMSDGGTALRRCPVAQ